VREASARKKAAPENCAISPLHCACINPDTGPLGEKFSTKWDPVSLPFSLCPLSVRTGKVEGEMYEVRERIREGVRKEERKREGG
jgi:hypothetical protein